MGRRKARASRSWGWSLEGFRNEIGDASNRRASTDGTAWMVRWGGGRRNEVNRCGEREIERSRFESEGVRDFESAFNSNAF